MLSMGNIFDGESNQARPLVHESEKTLHLFPCKPGSVTIIFANEGRIGFREISDAEKITFRIIGCLCFIGGTVNTLFCNVIDICEFTMDFKV